MFGYIYMTTNLKNNKRYIGKKQSDHFLREEYLGSGILLKRSVEKYGKENFSVEMIDTAESRKDLDMKEIYWIEKYSAVKDKSFYNIAPGGSGGNTTRGYTKEQYKIYCDNLSKTLKGRKFTNEHKQNISKGKEGHITTKEHREKLKLAGIKGEITDEHKQNISKSKKGSHLSESTKNKIRETLKNDNKSSNKRMYINNGIECKLIRSKNFPYYKERGWIKGKVNKLWNNKRRCISEC